MNHVKKNNPFFAIFILIFISISAFAYSFKVLDDGLARPNAEVRLAFLIGLFFITFVWAFLLFLQWRDRQRAARYVPPQMPLQIREDQIGTVYGLIPGRKYKVIKPFTDFYGNHFEQNELLEFSTRHFLPYDGGHTIMFKEKAIYLQEDVNKDVLDHFSEYIVQIEE